MIDLHIHSEFSIDAKDSPETIVARAAEKGLHAIALADHTCTDGLPRARRAAAAAGLEYVSGIECGGSLAAGGAEESVHVLGYFLDENHPRLRDMISRARERSDLLAEAFLAGLASLGIPLTAAEVARRYPGRVSSWALRRLLREDGFAAGKPESSAIEKKAVAAACEGNPRFATLAEKQPVAAVIADLKAAGAQTFFAHPFWLTKPDRGGVAAAVIWAQVEAMLDLGVDGLEAFNTGNDAGYAAQILDFCRARGLPAAGGSDSHGAGGVGAKAIPGRLLESMKRHRAGQSPWD